MSINPLDKITSFDQLSQIGKTLTGTGASLGVDTDDAYSFSSVFSDAIGNVEETDAVVKQEAYKLATGQTDNLHDITIASTQAGLAVDLFVQIRNKSLSAYQEIMNLNI